MSCVQRPAGPAWSWSGPILVCNCMAMPVCVCSNATADGAQQQDTFVARFSGDEAWRLKLQDDLHELAVSRMPVHDTQHSWGLPIWYSALSLQRKAAGCVSASSLPSAISARSQGILSCWEFWQSQAPLAVGSFLHSAAVVAVHGLGTHMYACMQICQLVSRLCSLLDTLGVWPAVVHRPPVHTELVTEIWLRSCRDPAFAPPYSGRAVGCISQSSSFCSSKAFGYMGMTQAGGAGLSAAAQGRDAVTLL